MSQVHEPIPTREPRFQCIRCGQMCQDTRGLSNHQLKCNIDPRFSCKFCKKMCSSAQTLYRHEDKCKAIRSAQLEIDKINQLEQLTLSLKQKEDQYTLFQEQILQYQTQIQEMGMTIQQLKDIQQTQEQEISSSASTINRLNNLVNQQQSRIDSYQDTIVEKNQRINSLEEQAREDRKIIFDFAFKTIELRKQVQDNQCF